jgi:hypothetical protein
MCDQWPHRVCAALLLISSMSASAAAQTARPKGHDFEVAVGVMVPAGSALRDYSPGPTAHLGVVTHWPERGGSAYRLDFEGYRLKDHTVSISRRSLTGVGVGYSWLGVAPADTWRPYVLAGLGMQLLLPNGGDGYPGLFGAVRAGAGVRGVVRGVHVQVEAAAVACVCGIGKARLQPLTVVLHF